MSGRPLVSVIVPVYNAEKYLRLCLGSLVNQTLANLEIICVDDGSFDNSPQILKEYTARDNRITVIQQKNGGPGPAAARNAGLNLARAPYIGFVDADDTAVPEAFETAVKIMLEDKELDFVQWGAAVYNALTGEVIREDTAWENERIHNNPGKHMITDKVATWMSATAWSKLYKADIIKSNQLSFPAGLYHEDVAFVWQYVFHARCGFFLDKPLINYFKRPESLMGLKRAKAAPPFDDLKIIRLIFDYYQERQVMPAHSPRLRYVFEYMVSDGYQLTSQPGQFKGLALEMMKDYGLAKKNFKSLMKLLSRPQDYRRPKYTVLEKMASIKNEGPEKVIRFLGLKFRFKRRPAG